MQSPCVLSLPRFYPFFTFNALGYPSITPNVGSLPAYSKSYISKEAMENVYIFIFDEWSYQRSFKKKELITRIRKFKKI